ASPYTRDGADRCFHVSFCAYQPSQTKSRGDSRGGRCPHGAVQPQRVESNAFGVGGDVLPDGGVFEIRLIEFKKVRCNIRTSAGNWRIEQLLLGVAQRLQQ